MEAYDIWFCFSGLSSEEELAECSCTVYQEHDGKTPKTLLTAFSNTRGVHHVGCVLIVGFG